MKKKHIDYLNTRLQHDNNDKRFLLALYYYYNSKTDESMLFSSWASYYLEPIPTSCVSMNETQKNLKTFINNCKINNNINEEELADYTKILHTLKDSKHDNVANFIKNVLFIITDTITKKNYNSKIRDLTIETLKEKIKLNEQEKNLNNLNKKELGINVNKFSWNLNNTIHVKYEKEFQILNEKFKLNEQKINNLYNVIIGNEPINDELFKNNFNSNQKGIIGEKLFAKNNGGEVVGFLGKKTDVIIDDKSYSIKTTYGNSWNHHLAYITDEKIKNKYNEKKKFSTLLDFDLHKLVMSFINGEQNINFLALQIVKMDELNSNIEKTVLYNIPIKLIEETLTNNNYFFNNNELILINNKEQFLKFSIKNRSQSLQVMLSTCNKSLDNLVDLNLIEKKEHVLNMKIINKTKKK